MDEYDILVNKLRNNHGRISEEEAMAYLEEDIVYKIFSMLHFCKQDGWKLLLHGTSVNSAKNIMNCGYKLGQSKEINQEEFLKKVGIPSLEHLPENGIKYENITGDISDSISIEYADNKSSELKENLAQHFTGYNGFSDLVGRFITHNAGFPCDAMVFVLYPNFINETTKMAKDYYGYEHNIYDIDDAFYVTQRLPRGIVLGYLDIKQKKFVINPHFSFHTLGEDNTFFQATDMHGHHFSNFVLDEQQRMINAKYNRR